MPWKMDGEKVALQDGNPVWIGEGNRETPFNAEQTLGTIARLNGEARDHRVAKEDALKKLETFAGIEDPAAALKALETMKNIDESKLIAANKVEEIKLAAKKAAEDQVAAANKKAAEDLAVATKRADTLEAALHNERIGNLFGSSAYVRDKTILPADAARKLFGDHFKIEEGKVMAYDAKGAKVYSHKTPGEPAEFEEALSILVDAYPNREFILRGTGGGSGARGGSGGGGGEKTITRVDFDKLTHLDKMKRMQEGYKVVDA